MALLARAAVVFGGRTLLAGTRSSAEPLTVAPTAARPTQASAPAATVPPTRAPTAAPTVAPTATGRPAPAAEAPPRATATTAAPTRAPTSAPTARPTVAPTPVPIPAAAAPARPGALVALTFDAGADRGYAEDILDLLKADRIPASFGMTGQWAKANPDLVRRMGAEGHLVINHTLDHRSFTGLSDNLGGLSAAKRRAELEDADAIIAPLIGPSTKPWYRLPYGDDDAHVAADVAPAGYSRKVGWTVDSLGWRGTAASEIVARCLKLAAPNAIYVMHVGRDSQDGPALERVVAGLRERGFGFATVADLP